MTILSGRRALSRWPVEDWLKVKNRKQPAMDRARGHSNDDPGKVACAEAGAYRAVAAEDIGPDERDEIERLLEKIEAALDWLDKAGPSGA
jgi:hypothetical protein